MRFRATFRMDQQATLEGYSKDYQNSKRNYILKKCHEFSVQNVKSEMSTMSYRKKLYPVAKAEVSLVAGAYSQTTLHGPASLKETRSIIYPCSDFQCRLPCPCHRCRRSFSYCRKAESEHSETCGDCFECKQDLNEHLLFHRAVHISCKFCSNVSQHIPHFKFVVCQLAGYWPDIYEKQISASLFDHQTTKWKPEPDQSLNYQCDKCDNQFKTKSDLRRHERALHFLEEFQCSKCELKFSRKDNMETHIRTAHSDQDSMFECKVCDLTFSKKCNYVRHRKMSLKMKRDCEICSDVFCSLKQVQQHIKEQHSKHSCGSCKKSFSDKAKLRRHTEAAQTEPGVFNHQCVECESNFCTSQTLVSHMKTHELSDIVCQYCEKTFSTKWRLKVHIKNRKETFCVECGKTFCNGFDLKQHNFKAHILRVCRYCKNGQYRPANYKLHMFSKHQELVE